MSDAKDPVTQSSDLVSGWAGAVLAAEVAALALLKAEMEGLSVLFGGDSTAHPGPKSEAERRAEDAAEEAGFDNMPV